MMLCFVLAGLAPLTLAEPMQHSKKMEVSAVTYPSYVETTHTPVIGENAVALRIAMAPQAGRAVFRPDEPWPLFGAFRVGREVLKELGTAPERYVYLIVRHKETNSVYFGLILKDIPIGKEGSLDDSSGGMLLSVGQPFAVDLKAQCHIPPRAGKYWATAILGTLASGFVEFEVR